MSTAVSGGFVRKDVFGIVDKADESYWTKIGVAFLNKDGSWYVKLDYFPARNDIKMNIRDPKEPGETVPK